MRVLEIIPRSSAPQLTVFGCEYVYMHIYKYTSIGYLPATTPAVSKLQKRKNWNTSDTVI